MTGKDGRMVANGFVLGMVDYLQIIKISNADYYFSTELAPVCPRQHTNTS